MAENDPYSHLHPVVVYPTHYDNLMNHVEQLARVVNAVRNWCKGTDTEKLFPAAENALYSSRSLLGELEGDIAVIATVNDDLRGKLGCEPNSDSPLNPLKMPKPPALPKEISGENAYPLIRAVIEAMPLGQIDTLRRMVAQAVQRQHRNLADERPSILANELLGWLEKAQGEAHTACDCLVEAAKGIPMPRDPNVAKAPAHSVTQSVSPEVFAAMAQQDAQRGRWWVRAGAAAKTVASRLRNPRGNRNF